MAENRSGASAPPRPVRPMGPGGRRGGGRVVEKPRNFKKAAARLIKYITAFKAQLLAVAVLAAASTVFTVASPKILGNATTEIYNGVMAKLAGTGGGIDFAALGRILAVLSVLYAIGCVFQVGQSYIMNGVVQKISASLRSDINRKLLVLPMKYFDTRTNGEILSYITNDVDTVTQGVSQSVSQIITSIATVTGVLIMMISINVWMTLAVLIVLPLSGLMVAQVVKRTQPLFKRRQAALASVNGIVEESYGGHTVIKAFNHEEKSMQEFERENSELYRVSKRSEFLGGFVRPIMDFMSNVSYIVVAVLGAYAASVGAIQVGDIQSFINYSRRFSQPINQVAQVSNMIQSTMAAAERVFALLDEEEEDRSIPSDPSLTLRGEVRFDHVGFGYDPSRMIIHDFSATASPGRKIAIVGPTGAGKTTMVKLLMRFYDVQKGAILVDGIDIRDIAREDLRRGFGMVLQDTWLFSGTIRENIRYGRPDASDEEVYEAARAARADRFIRSLSQGYDTIVNEEGTNISQGQKQLLTIARAILKDPEVLILDEATSSVDTRTEILIQKAMDTLMEGRTSFIIAHRLSTIRDADEILVMRDGDIVEQGKHQELLDRGGFYAELYNSQFENKAI